MNSKLAKIIDYYISNYGSDVLPKLKKVESEEWHLVQEFEKLKQVREDPKWHGDVSSLTHSLRAVILLQRIYDFVYKQKKHSKLDVKALEKSGTKCSEVRLKRSVIKHDMHVCVLKVYVFWRLDYEGTCETTAAARYHDSAGHRDDLCWSS